MTNEKKNSLLMIAPFPPPITGQSFASNFLYEKIKNKFDIKIINYTRKDPIKKSKLNFDFISKVIKIGSEIRLLAKKSDIIYFTVSQSLLGNIKDLFFLFKIGKFNRKKTIIHLHGGYFDQYLKNSPLLIKLLNKYFFKNIKAGIVLGDSLKKCFLPICRKIEFLWFIIFIRENIKSLKKNLTQNGRIQKRLICFFYQT